MSETDQTNVTQLVIVKPAEPPVENQLRQLTRLERAYMDLEPDVCELVRMKDIVMLVIHNEPDLTQTAAERLGEMVDALRTRWYKLHKAARKGA